MTDVIAAVSLIVVMTAIAFALYHFIKLLTTGPHTEGRNRNNRDD